MFVCLQRKSPAPTLSRRMPGFTTSAGGNTYAVVLRPIVAPVLRPRSTTAAPVALLTRSRRRVDLGPRHLRSERVLLQAGLTNRGRLRVTPGASLGSALEQRKTTHCCDRAGST